MGAALRTLHISIAGVFEALRPAAVGGALMSVAVAGVLAFTASTSALVQLVTSVAVGTLVYTGAQWWLQRELVLWMGGRLWDVIMRRNHAHRAVD
jgi:hypothetical protein